MTQVDKNFVATGQLSAVDGMGPSPIATAGAVKNFAVIRKMARLGTRTTSVFGPAADLVDSSQIDMIAFCSKISIGKETYGTTDAGYFVS